MTIRVAVVSSYPLVRDALGALISMDRQFELVSGAATAREACDRMSAPGPDVIVMDVPAPEAGLAAEAREMKRRLPNAALVLVGSQLEARQVEDEVIAETSAYISKQGPGSSALAVLRLLGGNHPRVVERAMDTACAGGAPLLAIPREENLANGGLMPVFGPNPRDPMALLTPRQKEVFRLLANGSDNDTIAAELKISVRTVETHRATILGRLRLRNLAELVRLAARNGLLD